VEGSRLTGFLLQAYDSHCNLVLGEVEETIYTVDEEDEGGNGEVRTVKKQSEMLFVRGMLEFWSEKLWRARGADTFDAGDSVVLISPQQ